MNLDASLVSVWDQTNVDAFQDTPGKPAVKISTRDHGGNRETYPRAFRINSGSAVVFGTQYTTQNSVVCNSDLQMKVVSE